MKMIIYKKMINNTLNLDNRNVTISMTYQELQDLMRDCADYTIRTTQRNLIKWKRER